MADAPGPDPVGDRGEHPPQRRAVEPRRGSPVSVELDGDRRLRAADPDESRLVRALRHDRRGPEGAGKPPDPERQAQVEERPVDDPRPPDELEDTVVVCLPVGGGRQHPQVEALAERRELPRGALPQRDGVARARDHQQAGAAHVASAASTSARTRSAYSSGEDTHAAELAAAAAPRRTARS